MMKDSPLSFVQKIVHKAGWILAAIGIFLLGLQQSSCAAISLVQAVHIGEYDTQYLVTNGVHLPMPSTVQVGDVAVVWLSVSTTAGLVSVPQGWTAITGAAHLSNSYIGAAGFYKVLTQEDASTPYVAFNVSGSSATTVGFMDIYRGVDPQNPIAASSIRKDGNYSATPPCPSLSIPAEGCWIVALIASEGNPGDMTPPSGFTSHGSVWWPKVCSADNSGSPVATGSYTAANWTLQQGKQTLGCMVALAPAGATGINTPEYYLSRERLISERFHTDYREMFSRMHGSRLFFNNPHTTLLPNGRVVRHTARGSILGIVCNQSSATY
jgi:hypothetical protein